MGSSGPSTVSHWPWLLPLLVLGVGTGGCTQGRYGQLESSWEAPPHNTLWGGVRGGFSMPFASELDVQGEFLNSESLDVNATPTGSFGIDLMARLRRFDAGVRFDSWGGGEFDGLQRVRDLGGRLRVLAAARWRALDKGWGSIYVAPAIGVQVFEHSEDVRNRVEVVAQMPAGAVRPKTDTFNSGFAFQIGVGLALHPARWVILRLEAALSGAETSITADNGEEIDLTEGSFGMTFGAEFRVF